MKCRMQKTETVNKPFLPCGNYTIEVAIRQPAYGLSGLTSTKKTYQQTNIGKGKSGESDENEEKEEKRQVMVGLLVFII